MTALKCTKVVEKAKKDDQRKTNEHAKVLMGLHMPARSNFVDVDDIHDNLASLLGEQPTAHDAGNVLLFFLCICLQVFHYLAHVSVVLYIQASQHPPPRTVAGLMPSVELAKMTLAIMRSMSAKCLVKPLK